MAAAIVRYRWLLAVLGIALLLDVLFFTGYHAFDDKDYTWAAHQIASGKNPMTHGFENYELAAVRLAYNFPLAVVYLITGGSVAALCASQMLYHLGCVVVAYALARTIATERAGRIAAVTAAICPLLYVFAGAMFPDVALAMWTGLSLLLLVRAIHRAKHPDEPGWRSPRLFVAAGLVLGIAYSIKATALLMCFPSAIAIILAFPSLRRPRWLLHGACLALGLAIVLVFELLIFRALTGEWVSQLTVSQSATNWDFPQWMAKQGAHPLVRINAAVTTLRAHMPIMFIALVVGLGAHTISRRRNMTIVVFAWFNFLYLCIGTVSLTRYLPQPLFPRYFTPIIIPMVVALACTVTYGLEWWERRPRRVTTRVVGTALIVVLATTAVFEVRENRAYAGTLLNSEWARGLELAYERARTNYPEYPIVLSMEVTHAALPLLLPDLDARVYWHATNVPWGDDGKVTPKPPFVFLDWTRKSRRSGLAQIPGIDLEHAEIETVAIVRPNAVGLERLLTALGGKPPSSATTQDATTIQLVRYADKPRAPAPIVAVRKQGPRGLSISSEASGVSLGWKGPGWWNVILFDDDEKYNSDSVTEEVDPPARELAFVLGVRASRGSLIGSVEVIAYNGKSVVDQVSKPLTIQGGAQEIVATLRGSEIDAYLVRWSIGTLTPGGLVLDPIKVTTTRR